jgi:protein TonB
VRAVKVVQTDIENGQLRTPTKIPQKVAMIKEEEAPPPVSSMGGVMGGVPGGVPGGQMGGVLGSILSSTSTAAPKLAVQRVRVSQGVSEGNLISQMKPPYPPMAKMARVQGAVVLQALISKQGTIQNLRVVSGHPMLVQAALDAVKQWRYRPYLLNGEPVEVETQITLNFSLTGG